MATPSETSSAVAVAAGFIVTGVLSTVTDSLMRGLHIFPPQGDVMADHLFVVATIYRILFAVLGGYITAAMAPGGALVPVLVLGALGELAAFAGLVATWNAGAEYGPHWYPIVLVATAMPCVLTGLVLRRGWPLGRV